MGYPKIARLSLNIKCAYDRIGAEAEFVAEEPASVAEVDAYDAVWHHKLGFMRVPNGDIIALDVDKNETDPPVVYLIHDGGEGHGYTRQ